MDAIRVAGEDHKPAVLCALERNGSVLDDAHDAFISGVNGSKHSFWHSKGMARSLMMRMMPSSAE
eukprot:284280-Pleurochrysis_carterae.AAC.2